MEASESAPNFRELFLIFADQALVTVPEFEVLPGDRVPQPARDLLVHEHHMTVTLEQFYGRRVELRVLAERRRNEHYARMILLALEGTDQIVQFGIVRVDLSCCEPEVQAAILAGKAPLGRILIEHDVLRRIDPAVFLKIYPHREMQQWMRLSALQPVFGRLATIYCNHMPAVELLEVVCPPK